MTEETLQTTEQEEEQFEPIEDLQQFKEDQRLGASEEDGDLGEEDEAKREKRREERKARRERQKEARDRQNTELNFLRQRNEQLERRFSELDHRMGQSELRSVDTQLMNLDQQIKLADDVISQAITNQKGPEAVEAQSIRDKLIEQKAQLNYLKNQRIAAPRPQQPSQPPVNPELLRLAQNWMSQHTWWDPQKRDEDSRKVSEIDTQLVNEGFDPTHQDYWDELSDRVRDQLPHRFKSREKGPTFVQSGSGPRKSSQVYISPERKAAMVEAGVWDDPKLRQRYLKQYAAYDREHKS